MMLSPADYVVLLLLILLSLFIGVYQSRTGDQQRTRAEFILNNRQLSVIPTVISYMVSYQSAVSVLAAPAELYQWGSGLWLSGDITLPLGLLVFERLALPTFYHLGVMSIYEYFELRYKNATIKHFMSFLGILKATLYMGVNVLGPSIALETLTGLPLEAGVLLMAGVCALYTSLGGIRAVIWTDVLQCLVMIAGLLVVLVFTCIEVGGFGDIIKIGNEYNRLNAAPLTPSMHKRITMLNVIFTFLPMGFVVYGVDQAAYQRYASLPSLAKSRLTMWLMVPCNMFYSSLCYLVGAGVFAYYVNKECDPMQSGDIAKTNQILPYFVSTFFRDRPGGRGLFLAVLYGASLSSVSSILSGCSANTWEDHLKRFFPSTSERRSAFVSRFLVFVYALLAASIAIACSSVESNIMQLLLTLNSGIVGPMLGVYLMACLSKRSEWRGALVGCISGIVFTCWIAFSALSLPPAKSTLSPIPMTKCVINATELPTTQSGQFELAGVDRIYSISFLWYIPIGCIIAFVVGSAVSEILKKIKPEYKLDVSDRYVINYRNVLSFGNNFFGDQRVAPVKTDDKEDEEESHNLKTLLSASKEELPKA